LCRKNGTIILALDKLQRKAYNYIKHEGGISMQGCVFNVQKFCVNDGPGIRTTVFLKGCPLSCLWCHNPESKGRRPEIMYDKEKCIGCKACLNACSQNAHLFNGGIHSIDRKLCTGNGECARVCPTGALEPCGYTASVGEIISEVAKDEVFYRFGGGMTVSGGEPLFQPDFTEALLRAAKERGIHTAIETSGYAKTEIIERLIPLTDLFLYDLKLTDPEEHKRYTGVDNRMILNNLRYLNGKGARVILRLPIIPGINDNVRHFEAVGRIAEDLPSVKELHVEPYHPLGEHKSELLGKDYTLKGLGFPEKETVDNWIKEISSHTSKPVLRG